MAQVSKKGRVVKLLGRSPEEAHSEVGPASQEETFERIEFQNAPAEEVEGSATDNLEIKESTVSGKRRGRPPGSKNKATIPTIQDAAQTLSLANMMLGITNMGVVSMFGPECQLAENEKQLLYQPLARIVARLPAGDAAKAAVFLDPIMLLFGVAVWTRRIVQIKSAERQRINDIASQEFIRATGIHTGTNDAPTGVYGSDVSAGIQPEDTSFRNGTVPTIPENNGAISQDQSPTGGIPPQIRNSFPDDL